MNLPHQQFIGATRENDGHAAVTRPVILGSATATLAARLAALPTTSSAHGSNPLRPPTRESAGGIVDTATIPSTDNGVSAAHPPRLAAQLHQQVHISGTRQSRR